MEKHQTESSHLELGQESNHNNGELLKASPLLLLGVILFIILSGLIISQVVTANPFGSQAKKFNNYSISPGFMRYEEGENTWTIQYEKKTSSQFKGSVRHVSPIRLNEIPLLTHDILVTSGDYADPELVTASVSNHRFRWQSLTDTRPDGRINLLHTVPKDESIYQQLMSIQTGDTVLISGWEILRIDALDSTEKPLLWWQDDGCNTLLVDGVEIIK